MKIIFPEVHESFPSGEVVQMVVNFQQKQAQFVIAMDGKKVMGQTVSTVDGEGFDKLMERVLSTLPVYLEDEVMPQYVTE